VDAANQVIGAITSVADLRKFKELEGELREAAATRELLYRELTHRVKNHLQIMTGLVALAARNPRFSTKDMAEQIKGQLLALAAVYRGMERAEVGARIEALTFLKEVCLPYAAGEVSVETKVAPPDLTLPSELAGPVGMLVNEAVCNCHKHAFPERHGHIHVSLSRPGPGRLRVEVADDGVGWGATNPCEPSHGLDLMRMFAEQMHGELELRADRLGGALVAAEMPEAAR
jgi:two-component sensor histidine kinase